MKGGVCGDRKGDHATYQTQTGPEAEKAVQEKQAPETASIGTPTAVPSALIAD
jgi:hypothetical protein